MNLQIHHIQQCILLILGDKCPCGALPFKRIAQAVITAVMDQFCQIVPSRDLFPDLLLILGCELLRIEFVAECSGHGNDPSCLQRCDPAVLLIRADRDMGAHTARRISERCTVLDAEAVDRVCIVTAPDLRRVVKHACIETSAAAAAPLDQHIRIALRQSLQKVVKAEDIVIKNLSLIFGCV